jgi:hypothetical protein
MIVRQEMALVVSRAPAIRSALVDLTPPCVASFSVV